MHSLRGLVTMLEAHDPYVRNHSERVMFLSVSFACELGVGYVETLRLAAFLHDVGKLYVSLRVLRKKGPLDPLEWAEMREHPRRGRELVSHLLGLGPAVGEIIECHHERWDGSGYPRGLKGEEIPVEARLLAIADALDAMCSARPYRGAMDPEEAMEEIRKGVGRHFDPELAIRCVSLFGDLYPRLGYRRPSGGGPGGEGLPVRLGDQQEDGEGLREEGPGVISGGSACGG